MKKATILIVDDVSSNIQVAMNILREDNYEFSFATDGHEALNIIEHEAATLDLILLDIMMPKMDGFELCQRIKSNPSTAQIPIIFLTARVDNTSMKQGFEMGAVDYIAKPFHAEELLARVKTHVELYQSKQLLQKNNQALETKIEYGRKRFYSELEENQIDLLFLLSELMEFRSGETGEHIKRVAEVSALLAHYYPSLTPDDEYILYHASPMHDIGKMTIPADILHKPGKYNEAEFTIMKEHAANGYQLLSRSQGRLISAAAIIAHEHHEKWNGEGYPRQLKGEDIHIYGRIVAFADVFDALSHQRCYKDPWAFEEVRDFMVENSGVHFDPMLVDIFLEHIDEFKKILGNA